MNDFLQRTIMGIVSLLKETVSSEEMALRKGFLQGLDPRLKCLSVVLLLACILVTKNVVELAAIYLLCLILAFASSIKPGYFFKRTLLFIPLFSFFIVLPALFNVITPGTPVFPFNLFGHNLSITRQGIDSAIIFFMRVLSSVSFAILLVLTTKHDVLLKVLRIFRIPQLFVTTTGMTYRYIYLLLDVVQNTFTAIKSRVGFVTSARTGRRLVGTNMAGLWIKSYRLQTQVYDAMLSRGYSGEPRVLEDFRACITDFIVLGISFITIIGTLWLNMFLN